jgi:DNA-binding transcriptional MerR regulator
MFRIGHFARLSQVSIKALRYYDELGLLKPRQIDLFTGYRYYSVEQLPRLNRILALKGLGLSLEQIATLLQDDLPPSELRGMLRLKQAELRQRVRDEQARLAQVEARLRLIEHEAEGARYDVALKQVEPRLVAGIRAPLAAFPEVGHLTEQVYAYLQGFDVGGIDGAIWYDMEDPARGIDAEGVVFLDKPVPRTGRIDVHTLPAVESMACVVHHGPYNAIGAAYTALGAWIEANGYRVVGPSRDIYFHGGPDQDDPTYVTEIQFPVAQA